MAIVLLDFKDYGLLSWTLEQKYAERFKRLLRNEAVSVAIFAHEPTDAEVVVDIAALWKCDEFIACVDSLGHRQRKLLTTSKMVRVK